MNDYKIILDSILEIINSEFECVDMDISKERKDKSRVLSLGVICGAGLLASKLIDNIEKSRG